MPWYTLKKIGKDEESLVLSKKGLGSKNVSTQDLNLAQSKLLEKPMFCFAYDYEQYKQKRGFYID